MLACSTPSSGVVSGVASAATRLPLYPEASVLPIELAPLSATALMAGLTEAALGRIRRDSSAKIGQPRIPMIAAATNPLIASERMSLESLVWIF
jgi:hypothetical protein